MSGEGTTIRPSSPSPARSNAIRRRAETYFYRGQVYTYIAKIEPDRAISGYTEAIRLNPAFARAYDGRGFARLQQGEHDRAISDFTEAIRLEPRFSVAHPWRGIAYRALGRLDEAVADFETVLRLNPSGRDASRSRSARRNLGRSMTRSGVIGSSHRAGATRCEGSAPRADCNIITSP
jgi:tetratricopeptide (TPR) repeat protein